MQINKYFLGIDAPIGFRPPPDDHGVLFISWIEFPPWPIRDTCVHHWLVSAIVVDCSVPAELRQLPREVYDCFLGATESLSTWMPRKPAVFTIDDEVSSRGCPLDIALYKLLFEMPCEKAASSMDSH